MTGSDEAVGQTGLTFGTLEDDDCMQIIPPVGCADSWL